MKTEFQDIAGFDKRFDEFKVFSTLGSKMMFYPSFSIVALKRKGRYLRQS